MSNIIIQVRPGDIITVIAEGDLADAVANIVAPVSDPFRGWENPITADQRRALFANFTEVFGHADDETRYAFTRMALCLPGEFTVSWSENKVGSLTFAEASRVLDALNLLNV